MTTIEELIATGLKDTIGGLIQEVQILEGMVADTASNVREGNKETVAYLLEAQAMLNKAYDELDNARFEVDNMSRDDGPF